MIKLSMFLAAIINFFIASQSRRYFMWGKIYDVNWNQVGYYSNDDKYFTTNVGTFDVKSLKKIMNITTRDLMMLDEDDPALEQPCNHCGKFPTDGPEGTDLCKECYNYMIDKSVMAKWECE